MKNEKRIIKDEFFSKSISRQHHTLTCLNCSSDKLPSIVVDKQLHASIEPHHIIQVKEKIANSLVWLGEWKDMAVKQLVWGVKRNWHEQSILQSFAVWRLTGNN